MAKINVYITEMSSLSGRLKQISSLVEEAEQITSKVQSNLDFQVAVREGIASGLSKVRGNLRKQKDKVRNLAELTTVSEGEFRNADNQMDKKTYVTINKVFARLFSRAYGIGPFFSSIAIARHWKINSLFMPAGTIISIAGLGTMIHRLMEIIRKWKDNPVTPVSPSGNGNIIGNAKPYKNLVAFSGADYVGKTKGDYADYSILGGMKPDYCFNQGNKKYGNTFNKLGCLACADACAGSIMGNSEKNPEGSWNGKSASCKYTTRIGLHTKDDSCNWTPEQIRERTYQELTQGKPVVIRVQSESSEAGGHSVTVVGLRNGADSANLTDADFLIMDPADGKMKALSERTKVKGSDTCIKPEQDRAGMRRVK
ncbi:MAG: hypothetical protein K2P38_01825 [Lachnospiraceae bacterium]|nr:hypothetical protein [Lachnospiraceae bacterium]